MQQQKGKEEIENQVLSEYVHDFGKKKAIIIREVSMNSTPLNSETSAYQKLL